MNPMSLDPSRTPVLVGIGQSIERDGIASAIELAERAAEAALEDAPGLREKIQRVSVVAISFSPVSLAPATELASALGLGDVECEVTTPGGNSPQWLVSRACEQITKGELETTLLVGAEATRSMRQTDKGSDFFSTAIQDRSGEEGHQDKIVGASVMDMLGQAEIEAGMIRPADIYPMFENALSAKLGHSPDEARARIATFYARGTEVAARNPFAWFQQVQSAGEIAEATPVNRATAEPYTRCMNSFPNVDQAAALLITTLERATAAGLAGQCIFPAAAGHCADLVPVAREDLSASPAIRAASEAAFGAAGVGLDDIDVFDLYSCFPIAVETGAREIGLALDDPRGLTQTGFMSFFGGPGNNYNMHGIAAVGLRLRETGTLGYVSGNGGALSKHTIGVYGTEAPAGGFKLADTSAAQAVINASAREIAFAAEGEATVVAGTVVYGRDGVPTAAPVIADLPDGRRIAAKASEEALRAVGGKALEGRVIRVTGANPPIYSV